MEESLRGQNQHYEKNITKDVYNLTTQKLNTILGNNANRTQQNAINFKNLLTYSSFSFV